MTALADVLLTKLAGAVPVPASSSDTDLAEIRARLSVHEGDLTPARESHRTEQQRTPDRCPRCNRPEITVYQGRASCDGCGHEWETDAPARSPRPVPIPRGPGHRDSPAPSRAAPLVRVWEQVEPAARSWPIAGLVPAGAITILYGDGGQGKSLLALHLATITALGRPFAGRSVERRAALYIDGELDADEFVRRAYAVSRGLGLDRPPEGLHYWRLPGPLSDAAVERAAKATVAACGAEFIVLDSLTIATYTADPTAAGDMTAVLKAVEAWGTVVAIDHIAKPAPGANLSQYRPFGSAFKYNVARSVIQVTRADGGGTVLRQVKSNFGSLAEPVHLGVTFEGNRVIYAAIGAGDARLAGIEDHLPAVERVERALAAYGEDGATPDEIAVELGMSAKTIKNHLTALRQRDRAAPVGDGRWQVTSPGVPILKGSGSGPAADPPLLLLPNTELATCRACGGPTSATRDVCLPCQAA